MAKRGAEDADTVVVVRPGDDRLAFALRAAGDDLRAGEHLHVVVEFLVSGRPVFDALGDVRHVVLERDRDRLFRAVAGGLNADVFVPLCVRRSGLHRLAEVTRAVRVHGAVEIHGGDAVAVRRQHAGDDLRVGLGGRAFIVDDDVVALGIVRIAEDGQRRVGALVSRVQLVDNDVEPRLEALLEQVFLRGVVVAATAGDQQGAQRFLVRGGEFPGGEAGQCENANE